MSDRIAVMNGGRVEQVGTPAEIYNQPTTRFVADFIGDTNIFRGERTTTNGGLALDAGKGLILALPPAAETQGTGVLSVALRPEKIQLSPRSDAASASAHGVVENTNFLGGAVLYRITLEGGHRVLVQQPNAGASRLFVPGNGVTLDWTPADLVILKD
jgi:putative spermidine/putrescine transport system ATP-binding protein